jgi:hypothetical protein
VPKRVVDQGEQRPLLDSVSLGRYGPRHPTSSARTAEIAEDLLAVLCAGDALRIEAKALLQTTFTSWDEYCTTSEHVHRLGHSWL